MRTWIAILTVAFAGLAATALTGGCVDENGDLGDSPGWSEDQAPNEMALEARRCPSRREARYISHSKRQCAAIRFFCAPGETPFNDACGCGCLLAPPSGQFCGGFGNIQCPAGLTCMPDPSDNCDVDCGGADCGGICVLAVGGFCGGFGNLPCTNPGEICWEAEGDGCSPLCGGADCGGVCVVP